jgi:hypothetical protein
MKNFKKVLVSTILILVITLLSNLRHRFAFDRNINSSNISGINGTLANASSKDNIIFAPKNYNGINNSQSYYFSTNFNVANSSFIFQSYYLGTNFNVANSIFINNSVATGDEYFY